MTNRTAIDTIKGYFYQFDHAIMQLLELENDNGTIVVEGIEDVDINTATEETAIQCKYYANTAYNHSVIAKPVRLMLDHYKGVIDGNKKEVKYKLYGHYKSALEKLKQPIDLNFLKEHFLTYTEDKIKYFHHTELELTDSQLNDFISLLEINIFALEFEAQLSKILKLLKKQFSCNDYEAENFYYNNALKVIKEIAVEADISKRKVSKSVFLHKINFKAVLFNEWFIAYKGKEIFFKELKNQYFTELNINSFERFFLIEIPTTDYSRPDLKDLILTISKKWSKLSKREPDPICPYFYLHNISPEELLELKKELYLEGHKFLDGFPFHGSEFNPKFIVQPANNDNSIKLKILNQLKHIDLTVNEISKTKVIYQFFIRDRYFDISYPNFSSF